MQYHLFLERHGKIEKKHRKPDTHGIKLAVLFSLAEAVGFEPTSPCGLPDFESGPL